MFKHAVLVLFAAALLVACDNKSETVEPPPAATQGAPEAAPEAAAPEETEDEGGVWIDNDTYGVKFRVPEDWKVVVEAASTSVTSPDEAITILLIGTESGGGLLTGVINSLETELSFKDLKLESDKAVVLNGLPGQSGAGTAVQVLEEGDQEIQFLMNAVQVGQKGVAMMVFAEAEMYEARLEEVEGIMQTLQPR